MLQKSDGLPWWKANWRVRLILGAMALLGISIPIYINQQQAAQQQQQEQERLTAVVAPTTVTALGKLASKGEVIKLSAPDSDIGTTAN